ncbi:hypothetical protein V8E36_001598 [Tilletia maclaganii]
MPSSSSSRSAEADQPADRTLTDAAHVHPDSRADIKPDDMLTRRASTSSSHSQAGNSSPRREGKDARKRKEQLAELKTRDAVQKPATLKICVSDAPAPTQNVSLFEDRTAVAELDVATDPGTFVAQLTGLCASSARLMILQTVLELCLIFFGVHFRVSDSAGSCPHNDKDELKSAEKVCALSCDPDKVINITFRRYRRFNPLKQHDRPVPELHKLKPRFLTQNLWNFLEPITTSTIVIYVQLRKFPQAHKNFSGWTLHHLHDKFFPPSEPTASTTPEQQRTSLKRKRTAREAGPRYGKNDFVEDVRNHYDDTCAVFAVTGIPQATHILSEEHAPELITEVFTSVFKENSTISKFSCESLRYCIPLFAPGCYQFPQPWTTMSSAAHNGILVSPGLEILLQKKRSPWILRNHTVVVTGLPDRDERSCFSPPCPSLLVHGEAAFDEEKMKLARLTHEEEVQPHECNVPETAWAALHLKAAVSFWLYFMDGNTGTLNYLSRLRFQPTPEEVEGDHLSSLAKQYIESREEVRANGEIEDDNDAINNIFELLVFAALGSQVPPPVKSSTI